MTADLAASQGSARGQGVGKAWGATDSGGWSTPPGAGWSGSFRTVLAAITAAEGCCAGVGSVDVHKVNTAVYAPLSL
jgi:hypothetical protein